MLLRLQLLFVCAAVAGGCHSDQEAEKPIGAPVKTTVRADPDPDDPPDPSGAVEDGKDSSGLDVAPVRRLEVGMRLDVAEASLAAAGADDMVASGVVPQVAYEYHWRGAATYVFRLSCRADIPSDFMLCNVRLITTICADRCLISRFTGRLSEPRSDVRSWPEPAVQVIEC